jgi:hypothetical protein
LCLFAGGIADVVDIETQRFGEIVEALKLHFSKRFKQIQFRVPPADDGNVV